MATNTDLPSYLNTNLTFQERAKDLVSRMTLEEKVSQMLHDASEIPRLGVPAHNWWNECLHGVARAGVATAFPQAIGMAASWNTDLMRRTATVISDEARAKHHESFRHGDTGINKGLTFWTPNINIFRDPRWGRGQETYGEDPYLTGQLGTAFVRGLQGDDPKYLKLVATVKHFAVHSGPEALRHEFDAHASKKDMYETYLPAFKTCIHEGGVSSVMGAYNRLNGEPCCASPMLLQKILRNEWDFEGYVVSDCWAIADIHLHHKYTDCSAESAAISVKAGCDLECGCQYANLLKAVQKRFISEEEIAVSVERLFFARFKLGMFDPQEDVAYAQIPYEVNDCEAHRQLSLIMARESMVLLKNDGILPLKKDLKAIAVIGPNADKFEALVGNYYAIPSKWVTPLAGIRNAVSAGTRIFYAKGCELADDSRDGFSEAVAAAEHTDVAVVCLGLTADIEGEEGDACGDRTEICLPGMQEELLKAVSATGKPVILVVLSGSAIAVNWAQEHVSAIIEGWYPGEEGGTALADVIFGEYNPAGRLPVTFVKSVEDLPPFEDYDMKGRTYKYFEGEPLYPFGFGLSYTTFEYSELSILSATLEVGIHFSVKVKNNGRCEGDEVAQVYLSAGRTSSPIRKLVAFQRLSLDVGETKEILFKVTPELMADIDDNGKPILEAGTIKLYVGGSQGDARSLAIGAANGVSVDIMI